MLHNIIARRLPEYANTTAIFLGDAKRTYGDMARDIDAWSAWLARRGFARHSRVLLSVSDPYLFAVLFFALERCALTSVCSTPALEPNASRVAFLGASVVIAETAPTRPSAADWITIGADWPSQIRDADLPPAPQPDRRDDDPICILLSSGTTGEVKKVLLDRRVFEVRVSDFEHIRLMGSSRRALCVIPFFTVAGLSTLFYSLNDGGSVTYAVQRESWPAMFARRSFDAVLATPAQLQGMLAALPADHAPDITITVTVGGGAPSRELVRQIRDRLTSNIYLAYGSTEIGVITQCHIDDVDGAAEAAGFPVPTTTVQIVDETDEIVPVGKVGQLRVTGDNVVAGYVDDELASAHYFRSGWYYPGDIGRLDQAGSLTVLGRVDDLMSLNGAKLLPSMVEDRVATADPGAEVVAFSAVAPGDAGESLWLVAEKRLSHDAILALAPFSRFAIIRHSTVVALPRNAMGKADRVALRTAASAGDLPSRTATFRLRGKAELPGEVRSEPRRQGS